MLPPTASVELARARLAELPTGGVTPLAEGITAGLSLARRAADDGWPPLLVLITDGRATGNQAARERAHGRRRVTWPRRASRSSSSTPRTARPGSASPASWPRRWTPATSSSTS